MGEFDSPLQWRCGCLWDSLKPVLFCLEFSHVHLDREAGNLLILVFLFAFCSF